MGYKIEKNIPIPDIKSKKKRDKYPFKQMDVGDSFCVGVYTKTKMINLGNAGRNWAKKAGSTFKFACRKTINNQLRVWRVE